MCDFLADRQKQRNEHKHAADDKTKNPIVVVPGSAGCGKSTFLVHLPDSSQYREYVKERCCGNATAATTTTAADIGSGTGADGSADGRDSSDEHEHVDAVVSSFTFTDEMASDRIAVGLRALYGAARAMGLPLKEESWQEFYAANFR